MLTAISIIDALTRADGEDAHPQCGDDTEHSIATRIAQRCLPAGAGTAIVNELTTVIRTFWALARA